MRPNKRIKEIPPTQFDSTCHFFYRQKPDDLINSCLREHFTASGCRMCVALYCIHYQHNQVIGKQRKDQTVGLSVDDCYNSILKGFSNEDAIKYPGIT